MSAIEVRPDDVIVVHGITAASVSIVQDEFTKHFGPVHVMGIECPGAAVTVLRKAVS